MSRCIVSVATGRYVKGIDRLISQLRNENYLCWQDELPPDSPKHEHIPYAFKAFALKGARDRGHDVLLWCDASIVPVRSLESLWERIERDGYWISRNGWYNGEWTADAAYLYLGITREQNWTIPHVVATAFGLDLRKEKAQQFYREYLRLSTTPAFQGPWFNLNHPEYAHMRGNPRVSPCGDITVRGHRHDQTVASVLAWKLGMNITDPPAWFAYRGGETEETILVADGDY